MVGILGLQAGRRIGKLRVISVIGLFRFLRAAFDFTLNN
jgi:hypothetical protein